MLHRRHEAAHQVQIGTTDGACRDLDDRVLAMFDNWIGDALAGDFPLTLPGECFHERSSSIVYNGAGPSRTRGPG